MNTCSHMVNFYELVTFLGYLDCSLVLVEFYVGVKHWGYCWDYCADADTEVKYLKDWSCLEAESFSDSVVAL